jgi:hypothetical protein
MYTNIKNLPAGKYFTEHGYSQSYPWMVIASTPSGKTLTLAKVDVAPDPEWKPDFIPGGFCAHCTNQSDQTWLFDKVDRSHTVTIRKTKKGWARKGTRFSEDRAVEFYDYNF